MSSAKIRLPVKTPIKHSQEKWDTHFMKIAELVSEMSKDPSTKVGAVIVKDKVIYGTGYNGFPKNEPDYKEDYEDRQIKYFKIVHAENNAIKNAIKVPERSTIYVYPFMPCRKCFKLLVQKDIARIVTYKVNYERWEKDWNIVRELCKEFDIELVEMIHDSVQNEQVVESKKQVTWEDDPKWNHRTYSN